MPFPWFFDLRLKNFSVNEFSEVLLALDDMSYNRDVVTSDVCVALRSVSWSHDFFSVFFFVRPRGAWHVRHYI